MFCRFPAPFPCVRALVSDSTWVCIFLCSVQAGEEVAASTHFLSPKLKYKHKVLGCWGERKVTPGPHTLSKIHFLNLKTFSKGRKEKENLAFKVIVSHTPFKAFPLISWSFFPVCIPSIFVGVRNLSCLTFYFGPSTCPHFGFSSGTKGQFVFFNWMQTLCPTWQALALKNGILSFLLALIESRGVTSALNSALARTLTHCFMLRHNRAPASSWGTEIHFQAGPGI